MYKVEFHWKWSNWKREEKKHTHTLNVPVILIVRKTHCVGATWARALYIYPIYILLYTLLQTLYWISWNLEPSQYSIYTNINNYYDTKHLYQLLYLTSSWKHTQSPGLALTHSNTHTHEHSSCMLFSMIMLMLIHRVFYCCYCCCCFLFI